MSAEIIPFNGSGRSRARISAEEAWARFDAAQLRAIELYRDPTSNSRERMAACMEATRLHRVFARAMEEI